ncbi:hypothetical protein CEP52_010107 [Fusarium oligoseptatum]|uniref:Uncharacterized protein n=1 Tax=Fusarium oligoseptatum TaxID=2604345 RepID=A0A428T9Y9_9HYPO|nr:hypothetical protein CEP52_010107 [Fusarium oligoseptatum]
MHGLRIDEDGKEEVLLRLELANTACLTSMRKHLAHEFVHSDAELYDQFFREVFKNWSSDERSNPAPIWREAKFAETSIQV